MIADDFIERMTTVADQLAILAEHLAANPTRVSGDAYDGPTPEPDWCTHGSRMCACDYAADRDYGDAQ